MTPDSLVALIGDLGSMGFILYLTHRLTTHTIPRLATQFEASTDKQRSDFKELLREQRSDFTEQMQHERDSHQRDVTRIVDAITELRHEVRHEVRQ